MMEPLSSFYPRWIVANGWAEAAGLGTTLLIGRAAAPYLDREVNWHTVLLGAIAAVMLGVLLEGLLVGSAQARVLRGCLRELSALAWVKATMLGAAVAWLLGMVPSTVAALVTVPSTATGPTPEPSAPVEYGLALLLGLITGPVLGLGQWLVLRHRVANAARWIAANAAAWALGMVVIFAGLDQVPWSRGGVVVVLAVYLVCGTAGLVVGTIHGWVLRDLIRETALVAKHG